MYGLLSSKHPSHIWCISWLRTGLVSHFRLKQTWTLEDPAPDLDAATVPPLSCFLPILCQHANSVHSPHWTSIKTHQGCHQDSVWSHARGNYKPSWQPPITNDLYINPHWFEIHKGRINYSLTRFLKRFKDINSFLPQSDVTFTDSNEHHCICSSYLHCTHISRWYQVWGKPCFKHSPEASMQIKYYAIRKRYTTT